MQIQEKEYIQEKRQRIWQEASTQSIRLWEDAGAIPASVRDEGGYRYWYEEDLEAIKLMPHYREKQNLKSNPKCEESVKALLFFFVLNFEGYLKNYRLCDQVKYQKKRR